MIINMNRPHTCGGASIEDITCLQCKELRNIGDNLVNTIEHVAGTSFLNGISIDVKMEMNGLNIKKLLLRYPLAYSCRAVEPLADSPGLSCLRSLLLQVARRKIDTHSHRIIIAMSKTFRDILTQTADTHNHLSFVVDTSQMVRNKERLTLIKKGRIGLREYDGVIRALQRAM